MQHCTSIQSMQTHYIYIYIYIYIYHPSIHPPITHTHTHTHTHLSTTCMGLKTSTQCPSPSVRQFYNCCSMDCVMHCALVMRSSRVVVAEETAVWKLHPSSSSSSRSISSCRTGRSFFIWDDILELPWPSRMKFLARQVASACFPYFLLFLFYGARDARRCPQMRPDVYQPISSSTRS